jgi:hypothetical protein
MKENLFLAALFGFLQHASGQTIYSASGNGGIGTSKARLKKFCTKLAYHFSLGITQILITELTKNLNYPANSTQRLSAGLGAAESMAQIKYLLMRSHPISVILVRK